MIKLVCFDLDDTLIKTIHSVMLLCMLNGKEKEHREIQIQEEQGLLDYKNADYQRARLAAGLDSSLITRHFLKIVKPLNHIKQTIRRLHDARIQSIIITVGPRQVASAAQKLWGFDASFGSDYEVTGGIFTGKINAYVDGPGKVRCLQEYSILHGFSAEECVAVGDGSTDIPLFMYCSKSIAINASKEVRKFASCSVDTENLDDILPYIL